MNVPQISISSIPAKIGIRTTHPEVKIKQHPAHMSIRQPAAELKIDRTPSKLSIDQSRAWDQMSLKHIFTLNKEHADKGVRNAMQTTAKIAQEGNELMRIENNGNPIVGQAKRNSEKQPKQFNIGWIPAPFSVRTSYTPSKLHMNWKTNGAEIEVKANKPMYQFNPGQVDIFLQQKNSINFDVIL